MNVKKLLQKGSILLLLVPALLLQSCDLIKNILNPNEAPTVSLVADDYSAYTDQIVTFTATASDPDGDTLIYSWKINGTDIGETSDEISRYWLTSSTLIPTISVTVDDGNGGTGTASISITVTPAASCRIQNSSSYSIYYLRYRYSTSYSWSSDVLGSSTIPPGYTFTFFGLPINNYQLYLENSYGYYWDVPPSYTVYIGYGQHFDVRANSDNSSVTYWYPSSSYPNMVPRQQKVLTDTIELKTDTVLPETSSIIRGPGYTIVPIRMLDPDENDPNRNEAMPLAVRY